MIIGICATIYVMYSLYITYNFFFNNKHIFKYMSGIEVLVAASFAMILLPLITIYESVDKR